MANSINTKFNYYTTMDTATSTSIGGVWIGAPSILTKEEVLKAFYTPKKPFVVRLPPQTMRQMWKYSP